MKYAVISDLHIGPGDRVDQFGHNEFNFLLFLDFLEKTHDKIILLGDIFETLMPKKFGCAQIMLRRCFKTYSHIWKRFQEKQYIYIYGNHDILAKNVCDAKEYYIDDNVVFIHGHQFDSANKYLKKSSEIGLFIAGWSLRFGAHKIYKGIEKLNLFTENEDRFQKNAIEYIKEKNLDIVVTGHTHNPTILDYNGKIYMNSGSCSNGKFNYLSLDIKNKQYKAYCDFRL